MNYGIILDTGYNLNTYEEKGILSILNTLRNTITAYDQLIKRMIARGYTGGMVIIKHWKNESKANYLASLIQSYYPSCQITVLEPSYLRTFAMAQGQLMIDFEIPS